MSIQPSPPTPTLRGQASRGRSKSLVSAHSREALQLQRRGFSIREIARKQEVHVKTALNRIRRALADEQRRPPASLADWPQTQFSKLQQLERSFWPQAAAGDFQALWGVLKVMHQSMQVAEQAQQAAREARKKAKRRAARLEALHPPKKPPTPAAFQGAESIYDPWKYLYHRAETGNWSYYCSLLPERQGEILRIRDELRRVELAKEQEFKSRCGAASASPGLDNWSETAKARAACQPAPPTPAPKPGAPAEQVQPLAGDRSRPSDR